jgi:hypothetical protein
MKTALIAMLMSLAASAACTVNRPATKTIPKDTALECEADCGQMGMRMQSVVIILESAGCVCVPQAGPPGAGAPATSAVESGGAAAGGGAAVAAIIAAQQASRNQTTTTTSHH